jgi:dihydrofolate reductase
MKLILACDPNGGIGYQNKLPWGNIQGDLPRFKMLTANQTVVMGRNTWDSLPKKPLPGRINLVVTTRDGIENTQYVYVLRDIDRLFHWKTDAWLIGGARLISACWEKIDMVCLTKVKAEYTCDTFVDLSYLYDNFICERIMNYEDHDFQVWKRK